MPNCSLPTTGTTNTSVVLIACLMLGAGIVLWLIARRRGLATGTPVIIALALGATVLAVGHARTAEAAPCPSPTTTITVAATTTTAAPTSTTTTIPAAATTTSSTIATAGASSTTTFGVTWSSELPTAGSFTIATALPSGIGGETNAANNTSSITVTVSPP